MKGSHVMKPFLAVISPVEAPSDAHPDHTQPGDIPHPEHPIFYPLPPGAPVDPEYGVPDTHPDQGLPAPQPHPEHPIVLPPDSGGWLPPLYIWGPNDPRPTPPIAMPVPPTSPDVKWEVKVGWTATTGWIVIAVPTGAHVTPSKKK